MAAAGLGGVSTSMFLLLCITTTILLFLLDMSHAWSFIPTSRVCHRAVRPSSSSLYMKIQWDPYTGQFLDVGDDAEEIGVPSRTASKATGLKTDDLKIAGGNIGKANAYIAQKMAEDVAEGVDQLMKELDDLAVEGLAEGEEATWPEITEPMKKVLQNEQAAALETVRRNVDLTRASTVLLYGKESNLASAVKDALKARGGPSRDVAVGDNPNKAMAEVKDAQVLVLLPDSKEGPKLPFGGGGAGGVLEAPQVEALITAAAEGGNLRHVVYMSSLGSEKAQFQFSLDSMSGALEKKKAVEQSIRRLSKTLGFNFSIVRVGTLVPAKSGEMGIALEPGDPYSGGNTNLDTAAQAVVQSIALPSALNTSFSLINAKGSSPPTDEDWRDNLLKLVGPEVLRQPFKTTEVQDMRMSLRAWALQFMEGERKLTTKVFAVRTPLGAKIYFLPTMQNLGPGFREEKAIEKARMKGDATPSAKATRPILEGGLEVCVEEVPVKRVRVRRIAMEEGTVVKAMSERELLESLKAEIESTEKLAASGRRVEGGAPPV